jgi:MinD superfamily P-loop ATPase
MYDMSEKVNEITKKSDEKLIPSINSIKMKRSNHISKLTKIFEFVNKEFIKKVSSMDKDYNVNNNCTGCAICEKVCPVKNIEIINSKTEYKHHCENCTACIQFCPQKAINYKDATQNRRRYTNPDINYMELFEYNKLAF